MDRGKVYQTRSKNVDFSQPQIIAPPVICTIHEAGRGLFISVTLCKEIDVRLLIDTGAMISILSNTVYQQVKHRIGVGLIETTTQLKQADGTPVRVHGTVTIGVTCGTNHHLINFFVADIQQDGILGMDMLLKTGSKTAIIAK